MSTKYLNSDNILKKVYDPATEGLRTTAVASFVGGSVEVIISDLTDSIKIGDGSGVYLDINPDGSLNAQVEVDAADGDNIMIVGTEDATTTGIQHAVKVDSQGSQSAYRLNALVTVRYDAIYPSYPSPTTEIYVYKQSASTVATVTVTYVDASKNEIISIVRT